MIPNNLNTNKKIQQILFLPFKACQEKDRRELVLLETSNSITLINVLKQPNLIDLSSTVQTLEKNWKTKTTIAFSEDGEYIAIAGSNQVEIYKQSKHKFV